MIITTHIYLGLVSLFTEGKALEVNEVHSKNGGGEMNKHLEILCSR